jgi:hypothetical protein
MTIRISSFGYYKLGVTRKCNDELLCLETQPSFPFTLCSTYRGANAASFRRVHIGKPKVGALNATRVAIRPINRVCFA